MKNNEPNSLSLYNNYSSGQIFNYKHRPISQKKISQYQRKVQKTSRPSSSICLNARPKSALNRSSSAKSYSTKLPSVVTNNSTLDHSISCSVVQAKNSPYPIEKEKLFEETMQYHIIINNLKRELQQVKSINKRKNQILLSKDAEIEGIIQVHELNGISYYNNNNNNNNSITTQQDLTTPTHKLINKIKYQKRIIAKQLHQEQETYFTLKKNPKITKANECKIENEIIQNQINQMLSFLNNSTSINHLQHKKITDNELLETNLDNQTSIIELLKHSLNESEKEGESAQSALSEIKMKLETLNKHIDKINKQNDVLKKQNNQLQSEQTRITYNTVKMNSLNDYENKIEQLTAQLAYYKSQSIKSGKIADDLQKAHQNLEKIYHEITDINHIDTNNKIIETKSQLINNSEEDIAKLQQLLDENKAKEQELEQQVYDYQEIISQSETLNVGINKDNPFYTDDPLNDPIQTRLFTNDQITEFTYVLYKNYESKKIFKEEAQSEIIEKIFDFQNTSLSLDELTKKFSARSSELLHCKNERDQVLMEIFFGALCCNYQGNAVKIVNAFLSLFSYLINYNEEKQQKLQKQIAKKYKESFHILKQSIDNYFKEENAQIPTTSADNEFISLLDIKKILDKYQDIKLKDNYVEYLFYYMKQFEKPEASLYDLKLSKLDELISIINSIQVDENDKNTEDDEEEDDIQVQDAKVDVQKEVVQVEHKKEETKGNENNNNVDEDNKDEINGDDDNDDNNKDNNIEDHKEVNKEDNISNDYNDNNNNDNVNQNKDNNDDEEFIIEEAPKKASTPKEEPKLKQLEDMLKESPHSHSHSHNNNNNQNEPNDNSNNHNSNELNNPNINNNSNQDKDLTSDSIQEISPEAYFKEIADALALISVLTNQLGQSVSTICSDSIVTIADKPYAIINVESFYEELSKRGLVLTEMQLSCLYNKYCTNDELKAMDIKEIEKDVEGLLKELTKADLNGNNSEPQHNNNNIIEEENKDEEGYYDNDENLDHSNSSDDQIKPKLNHSH